MFKQVKPALAARGHKRPKILIVDDEIDVLRSTQMLLQGLGYDCVVVAEAEHVAEVAATEQPDLILQDMIMEDLDLRALVQRLRSVSTTAKIPLVLFSASDDISQQAAELDVAGYLHKPFAEQELRKVLEGLLGPPPIPPTAPKPPAAPQAAAFTDSDREALRTYFHEYSNVLTALNNYAQVLLHSPRIQEPEREASEEINHLLLDLEQRGHALRKRLLGEA